VPDLSACAFFGDGRARMTFKEEKQLVSQFMLEYVVDEPNGYIYLGDMLEVYKRWRSYIGLPITKLSVISFARALPKKYTRKQLMRGLYGHNPRRAIMGVTYGKCGTY